MFLHESTVKLFFGLWDQIKLFQVDYTKIDAYIQHKFFEYDYYGNKTVTETRYEFKECDASDFNRTDYEREWWKKA